MKTLTKLLQLTFIAFLSFGILSCDDNEDSTPKTNTITDFVVANSSNYSILLAALNRADGNLPGVLSTTGPFTVFAPNDAAFTAFLNAKGFSSINDVPTDILSQILLNHVVSGAVQSSTLSTGYIETLSTATPNGTNMNMYVNTNGGVKLNGIANVTAADNIVDNGVIHLVDNVIDLPTVVTFAAADNNFSTLVSALTRDDQPNFVSILSTPNNTDPAPFTVFAPTNAAFGNLLTELGAGGLNDIDSETLTATLTLHVIGGANVLAANLSDNLTVNTLGGELTANVTGGATLTDANGRISNIIATDVQTANGVIHVIDKVVLPLLQEPSNTIADFVVANANNYSSLLAALQKADLVETLSGEDQFTVFAPNNDAFAAFLTNLGFNSLDDVPVDVLKQILLNHVVSGAVQSGDLSNGYVQTLSTATPNGANMSMYVNIDNGVKLNGISTVTGADNIVDNGVIHLVDAVIGLPTVVTFATADPSFSTLVAALTRDDQPNFVGTLSTSNGTSPAPFTVFAPTNSAFGNLLTELNVQGLSDINTETLTATLNLHVVGGANVTSDMLSDNMTVSTLGGDITANVTGGATLTDANGRISNIIAVNVQSSNGVIHVIDKVVLPNLN
jgi:transforming growth factor-beta-induced protein